MPSNNYSFSLANRHWDLLADEVHNQLFSFDKVIDQTSINFYNLILDTAPQIWKPCALHLLFHIFH